jgi:dihydroflavonol-4-reductase
MIEKHHTILITGATGFLGSYVARLLVQEGFTNIRAIRRATSPMNLVAPVERNIEWFMGDLLDLDSLEEALEGVDAVIHAAAQVSFHAADRDQLYEVNVTGTANLVNLCLDLGVQRLVHISSVAALGRKEGTNIIDEETDWQQSRNNSNYARSKFFAEMEVWRAFAEGLPVVVLNPSNILGAGFWNQGTARTFQKIWNGFPFYTEGMTGYVDVRDVAELALMALTSSVSGRRYIASENDYTYRQIFTLIAQSLQKKPPSIKVQQWMLPFARIGDWVKSRLQGKPPFLSREIVRASRSRWQYLNDRSREEFEFQYRPVALTIQETGQQFLSSLESHTPASILSY